MIPLYKLEKLPRTQKLRKIAKIFSFAENRLRMLKNAGTTEKGIDIFTSSELVFFIDAAKLLSRDGFFSQNAIEVFTEAVDTFQQKDSNLFLRALNNIKHLLLTETGTEQADWDFTCSDGRLDPQKRQILEGMQVYLEDIRSPFNVGAMFRTAESFGVEKIILSPFCADPRHRRAERTAMGCIDIVPWERRELFTDPAAIEANSQTEFVNSGEPLPIFALETGGIPITEFSFPERGLLIVGSEELGVSPRALAAADSSLGRVSIQCYGTKASLNVSVAFGIALQAWRSQI
jgi:TrmH family RNA methyltransferase